MKQSFLFSVNLECNEQVKKPYLLRVIEWHQFKESSFIYLYNTVVWISLFVRLLLLTDCHFNKVYWFDKQLNNHKSYVNFILDHQKITNHVTNIPIVWTGLSFILLSVTVLVLTTSKILIYITIFTELSIPT